jgi:hypothetical protein
MAYIVGSVGEERWRRRVINEALAAARDGQRLLEYTMSDLTVGSWGVWRSGGDICGTLTAKTNFACHWDGHVGKAVADLGNGWDFVA